MQQTHMIFAECILLVTLHADDAQRSVSGDDRHAYVGFGSFIFGECNDTQPKGLLECPEDQRLSREDDL